MPDPSLADQVSAAKGYEALLVPALFRQWAPRLISAATIQAGSSVLDVACGTGVFARAAASVTGSSGCVVGLDLSEAMLAVARVLAPSLQWHQGDADKLPFADALFDAVVCQFGLMFFLDRNQAVLEMWRVLRPGGRLAVAVWDSLDGIPAYAAEVALFERLAGNMAAEALRAPFVLGSRRELQKLARVTGSNSIQISTEKGWARFPGVRQMVEADARGWLPAMGVVLSEPVIEQLLEEAAQALDPYLEAQEGAVFPVSAHILSITKDD